MWGSRAAVATREGQAQRKPRSGALPGLDGADFPGAFLLLAGFALQPGLRFAADIAGQEVAAGLPVLGIGRSDWRDRAAGAGRGVFPRLARVFDVAAQHLADSRAGIGKIAVGRQFAGLFGSGRRRDRSGLLGIGAAAEQGIKSGAGNAASAEADGERQPRGGAQTSP